MELFKWKIIHIKLLCISVQQSLFIRWFINIVIIFINSRYTWGGILADIIHLPKTILLFLSCLLLNCHRTFLFLQKLNLFIFGIFNYHIFAAVKTIYKFWFLSTTTSANNKFMLPKPIYHWKTEHYQGLDDHCEVYLDSDINCLASDNTLLYPVSMIDCPGPEHGIFCISVVDTILKSALVLFSMLRASNYHYNKGGLKL